MSPYNNLTYNYLTLFFKFPQVLLFLSNSSLLRFLLMIAILMMHTSILFSQFKSKIKLSRIQVFEKAIEIFGSVIMQLVLMVLTIYKVRKYY